MLTGIFAEVHIPEACAQELASHGWQPEVEAVGDKMVTLKLTAKETRAARTLAREIVGQAGRKGAVAAGHMGEAQAIVLALRPEYRDDILLLDERAARTVASERGLTISGFPGVLLLAVQAGLISAESLRDRLERCREQGTHYGREFIEQVYHMARGV
ncbi:MAG: hypothetical protein IT318_11620 [Anaerolineales bacterium]|nr:hypothetical protein [Anaerolineales bacterium]